MTYVILCYVSDSYEFVHFRIQNANVAIPASSIGLLGGGACGLYAAYGSNLYQKKFLNLESLRRTHRGHTQRAPNPPIFTYFVSHVTVLVSFS